MYPQFNSLSYNCETEDYVSFAIKNLMVIIEAIPNGASWNKFGFRLFSDFILMFMIVVCLSLGKRDLVYEKDVTV